MNKNPQANDADIDADLPGAPEHHAHRTLRKAALASSLGNFIEWFDYASYSYFALVIAAALFPPGNSELALIETFAILAISFLMRPIGAVVWGNWGDKRGRKWALTVSILLMAGSTFLIGCLPAYGQIGIAAPLLLLMLRMVQGFSASGEYAGAAIFLAEYSPAKKRGMYVSLVPASTAFGLLAGSVSAMILHTFLEADQVQSWGWRLPFLLAAPLGLITHYIRTHVEDSPVYDEMLKKAKEKHGAGRQGRPVRTILAHHRKELAISFGIATLNAVAFYMVLTYLPTYLIAVLDLEETSSFLASSITLLLYVIGIFGMGWMSDRFGRKRMLIAACVGFIFLSIPMFVLFQTGTLAWIIFAQLILCLLLTANDGTMAAYLSESFPTDVRYTGFALAMNLANALFGGTAALISTWLIEQTGNQISPAIYLTVVSVGALVAMAVSHEHSSESLSDI